MLRARSHAKPHTTLLLCTKARMLSLYLTPTLMVSLFGFPFFPKVRFSGLQSALLFKYGPISALQSGVVDSVTATGDLSINRLRMLGLFLNEPKLQKLKTDSGFQFVVITHAKHKSLTNLLSITKSGKPSLGAKTSRGRTSVEKELPWKGDKFLIDEVCRLRDYLH